MNTQDTLDFKEKKAEKKISTRSVRIKNDKVGLTAIAKFGWLRPREIGNVLWAKNPSRNIAGARLARRWVNEQMVIERKLPIGFGSAFVLSKRGAEFVEKETEYGSSGIGSIYRPTSGKKIGAFTNSTDETWIPNNSWRHDLLANGFLTLAMGNGAQVATELEMRRHSEAGSRGDKIPDGIYSYGADDGWTAIEVERSGKWSTHARSLAVEIVQAATGGIEVFERKIFKVEIVYEDPNSKHLGSEDRAIANHFERVARQCEAIVTHGQRVKLIGIPLITHGGGVLALSERLFREIDSSTKAMVDKSVFGHEWESFYPFNKEFFLDVFIECPFTLRLIKGLPVGGMFLWEIKIVEHSNWKNKDIRVEKVQFVKRIKAGKLDTAKRLAVLELQKFSPYRNWASKNIDDQQSSQPKNQN